MGTLVLSSFLAGWIGFAIFGFKKKWSGVTSIGGGLLAGAVSLLVVAVIVMMISHQNKINSSELADIYAAKYLKMIGMDGTAKESLRVAGVTDIDKTVKNNASLCINEYVTGKSYLDDEIKAFADSIRLFDLSDDKSFESYVKKNTPAADQERVIGAVSWMHMNMLACLRSGP